MNTSTAYPNESIASTVVTSMTNEKVLFITRMTTGDQHFVYSVKTTESDYVIRMTNAEQKSKFISAIYWQEKLIPLGIPLAKFIKSDLNEEHSQFPTLLMMLLPGDDLVNIYLNLTDSDKNSLSTEIVKIQTAMNVLPDGPGFGISDSYQQELTEKSWYDFLVNRLKFFVGVIKQAAIFNDNDALKVISLAKNIEDELRAIRARPFLWDASERNVIVHNGRISGIVDVDEICFGDPLFVIALTHVGLANEGYDTLYTDYWAKSLQLDKSAQRRLEFYKLFYAVTFMRKHSMITSNCQKVNFNVQRLNNIFQESLMRIAQF